MADDDSGFEGDDRMDDDARSEDGAADVAEDGAGAGAGADADAGAAAAPVAPIGPDPLQLSVIQDPKLRFILELEFVEMLASPHYLQCTTKRLQSQQHVSSRDDDAGWMHRYNGTVTG